MFAFISKIIKIVFVSICCDLFLLSPIIIITHNYLWVAIEVLLAMEEHISIILLSDNISSQAMVNFTN